MTQEQRRALSYSELICGAKDLDFEKAAELRDVIRIACRVSFIRGRISRNDNKGLTRTGSENFPSQMDGFSSGDECQQKQGF